MRAKRRGLSPRDQAAAASGLLEQLRTVPGFLEAKNIAMYIANDGEIDPVEVMNWCWSNGKKALVPLVPAAGDRNLCFAEVNRRTAFTENRFGIPEPEVSGEQLVYPRHLDLVLLPLVAFDEKGNRIGMGGGFYDTTFAFLKDGNPPCPLLVGVAHDVQRVKSITADRWDIPLSVVVTNTTTYFLSPENGRG